MTDVARRSALSGKQRFDGALLERRRREALAELGETLHELVRSGELELDELPELARGVEEVDDLDRQIAEAEALAAGGGGGGRRPVRLSRNEAPANWARERGSRPRPPPVEPRVWRPGVGPAAGPPEEAPAGGGAIAPADDARGGIVFLEDDAAPAERDPDDSLDAYMNDEDVPRKR